jgi:hypothetical protein
MPPPALLVEPSAAFGDAMTDKVRRLARVAYAFVMMNYAAIAGLVAFCRGREVWR